MFFYNLQVVHPAELPLLLAKQRKVKKKYSSHHTAAIKTATFFTATPGPRRAAAELDSDLPADFLTLFLTDEVLQNIVDQTDLYSSQYFEARPDNLPYSRGNAWKPVSVPELKTFFGLWFGH